MRIVQHTTRRFSTALTGLVLCLLHAPGCRTSDQFLHCPGHIDKEHNKAQRVVAGVEHEDAIKPGKQDRARWKYFVVPVPGTLEAKLHWDNRDSRLELTMFNLEGVAIKKVKTTDPAGLQARVVVEEPGRYYLRVRGVTADDTARFTLGVRFAPNNPGASVCHNCTADERKCLGADTALVCEQARPRCNAWRKEIHCAKDSPCTNGICTPAEFEIGKIMSLYKIRGQPVLHIELDDNTQVRPGHKGTRLRGETNTPLAGGKIEVLRVSGRYCIAHSAHMVLGNSRRVLIWIR